MTRLSLRAGAAGVEAAAELDWSESERRDLRRVRSRLDRDPGVKPLDDPAEEPSTIFRFEGRAARATSGGTYFVAHVADRTALLLTGSSGNVIGDRPVETIEVSPSAHPVQAGVEYGGENAESAGKALSYTWQLVYRRPGGPRAVLPTARGLAVFAGAYPAAKSQLRRGGVTTAVRLVVGSPIYLEQV